MVTTMADVARAAGVSQTTVSHVLNKTRPVSESVAARVLDAISSTGYTSHGIARSLRTGTTKTVGIALTSMSNPYFGDVVQVMERELSSAGYSIVLVDTHDEAARERVAVGELLGRRVDAVIVAPTGDAHHVMAQLRDRGVAGVLFDRIPAATDVVGIDAVGVENVESTAQLVGHLAGGGHRRIAFLGGRPGLVTTEERAEGYRLGLGRAGIAYDGTLVRYAAPSERPAEEATLGWFAHTDRPTAIVTANNMVTIDTLRSLRDLGLRVPDDIALAAFDDFPWADLFHPRLTVMAQPLQALGHAAVSLLLERLRDPLLPARVIRLDPQFVHRDSCGVAHAVEPPTRGVAATP